LCENGVLTITLDYRTPSRTSQQEFDDFVAGNETEQYKMVYDVLAAYDILTSNPNVDKQKIFVAGESMGGRFAIISAAIEGRIKAVLAISTSGYGVSGDINDPKVRFMLSIDPDNYIADISPRLLVMIHSTNDTTIPIQMAMNTFSNAKEPKEFDKISTCMHGYCTDMVPYIQNFLRRI
jgi:dipeptidyl aminopeptidase/acylaminoacyl peptidase